MTHAERHLFNARVGELLHAVLVGIRNLAEEPLFEAGNRERINDLADLVHNLPRYIVGHDEHAIDSPAQLRKAVVAHVRRFHPAIDPADHRYVELLDMDGDLFLSQYRDHNWAVAEPAGRLG